MNLGSNSIHLPRGAALVQMEKVKSFQRMMGINKWCLLLYHVHLEWDCS